MSYPPIGPEQGAPNTPAPNPGEEPTVRYLPPGYSHPGPVEAVPGAASSSTATVIAIISSSLVVILLLVLGVLGLRMYSTGAFAGSPRPDNISDAAGVVEEYLGALADGDAATARDLAGGDSASPLLTQESLDKSNELAGISSIEVDAEQIGWNGQAAQVRTKFDVGDREIARTFHVRTEDGEWRLANAVLELSLYYSQEVALDVNGIRMTGDIVEVFPGSYEVSVEPEQFQLDGWDGEVVIASDADAEGFSYADVIVSPEGQEDFRELVTDDLDKCLAMTSVETPCGMALENDGTLGALATYEGKVIRELTPAGKRSLEAMQAEMDYSSPAALTSYDSIEVKITLDSEGKSDEHFTQYGMLDLPTVDFGPATPVVSWSYL